MTQNDPHMWLRDFPSTQATVFTGLILATLYVVVALVGALFERPLNEGTHVAMATFITALVGVNFAVKRFSDRDLAAARVSGSSPVVVDSAAVVATKVETPTREG